MNASSGAIAERIDYDAWGRVVVDTSPGFVSFGFAGGLYDATTGLIRFGKRDYDPRVGRWTTKDPAGFFGGSNQFTYVANSPATYIDPGGLKHYPEEETKKILKRARHDSSGPAGPFRAFLNHAVPGYLDFKNLEPDATFELNGSCMTVDAFGNFLAGYSGYQVLGGTGIVVVVAGGYYFNRFEPNPDDDESSRPDIEAGYEYAAYERALEAYNHVVKRGSR